MKGEAYRSTTTGDRGYLVEVDGKKYIDLDRPSHSSRRLYKERDWIKEDEHRPLLPQQIWHVYFQAEKYLRIALGDPKGNKMDWMMMDNNTRGEWVREEPEHRLLRTVREALEEILEPLGE